MPAQKATRSPETSILRFREIEGWKGTFSYKLDAGFKGAFGDVSFTVSSGELSSENFEKTEIQGEVAFSGGSRGKFVGQGRVSYRLQHFSLIRWGDKKILDTADGSGTAEILPDIERTYLQFDLREGSYALSIAPGRYFEDRGEFGVSAVVVREMDIVDSFLEDMRKVDLEVPFPQLLRAWFPEDLNEDGCVDIGINLIGFPLPAFGNVLSGTFTDYKGGVLSWDLEPIKVDRKEFMVPVEITSESDSSLHFHPRSQKDRQGMRGLTYEAEMAERTESEPSLPEELGSFQVTLFMLGQPSSPQETSTGTCSRRAVGVEHIFIPSAGRSDSSESRNSLMLKVAAHALQVEGGSLENVQDEGLLGKTLVALQDSSPEYKGVPQLTNELHERNLIEGITLEQTTAVIRLGGSFDSLEPCVRGGIRMQLEETASQFPFVNSVKFVSGQAGSLEE